MALLTHLSQADRAFFDTLLTKAEGDQFDRLCVMYGVLRPRSLSSVASWRQAARAAVFGKRDARGTVYQVLRHGLKTYDVAFTVRGDRTVADRKSRIYWVAGGGAAGFEPADVFRLWEVDGKVRVGRNGDGVWAGGVSTYLEMSPWAGHSWAGLDWTAPGSPVPPGGTLDMAAKMLSFTWWTHGAKVEVFADAQAAVPATYLQEQFQWPYQGTSFGDGLLPAFTVDQAGTLEKFRLTEGAEGAPPARGGDYTVVLFRNGIPTALTLVLGAAQTTVEGAGTLAVSAGDVLYATFSSAVGVTVPLSWPIASVFLQRPVGQPLGGHLQPDASSDDPTQGPWPVYLASEDDDDEFTDVLSRLVAAGVVAVFKRRVTPGVA